MSPSTALPRTLRGRTSPTPSAPFWPLPCCCATASTWRRRRMPSRSPSPIPWMRAFAPPISCRPTALSKKSAASRWAQRSAHGFNRISEKITRLPKKKPGENFGGKIYFCARLPKLTTAVSPCSLVPNS